jgi:hypothetical protein
MSVSQAKENGIRYRRIEQWNQKKFL